MLHPSFLPHLIEWTVSFLRNSISNLTSSLSSFDLSPLLSPLAFAKKMEHFKPFGDVVVHTVEESDDE